jgi:hypothetical protein
MPHGTRHATVMHGIGHLKLLFRGWGNVVRLAAYLVPLLVLPWQDMSRQPGSLAQVPETENGFDPLGSFLESIHHTLLY